MKTIKKGDTVIISCNSGIEDFVSVGDKVKIIAIVKVGEEHPATNEPAIQDNYWIDKIGLSPYAGLTIDAFKL